MPKLVKRGAAPTRPPEAAPAAPPATHALGHAIYHPVEGVTVHHADTLKLLPLLQDESIDAVVCDPPYALGFMGAEWDSFGGQVKEMPTNRTDGFYIQRKGALPNGSAGKGVVYHKGYTGSIEFQNWCRLWALEALRVLKPGGHLLAFGGTRMYHRLAAGIEDAGFEIRDCVFWCYGQGFPKSLDVSKAIDDRLGAEREKVKYAPRPESSGTMSGKTDTRPWIEESRVKGYHEVDGPDPVTPEALKWLGWGTALKPALEPVVVARKPLAGSVAQNILDYGTGGLNIDGCRIGTTGTVTEEVVPPKVSTGSGRYNYNTQPKGTVVGEGYTRQRVDGRWPANLMLDEEAARMLDEQSGVTISRSAVMPLPLTPGDSIGGSVGAADQDTLRGHDDKGGASRYFYTAKPAEGEKGEFCSHPTVKPVDLMRWLVRLVCRKGGVVLDPFLGSGTTAVACVEEGMRCIGIEREEEYVKIALARLHRQQGPSAMVARGTERVEL